MFKEINEGIAQILIPREEKVTKKMPVFYNPVMKFNRDMSVDVLNAIQLDNMQIGLPLAGTGVRGVRLALELDKGKVKNISMNDLNTESVELIKKNIKTNYISGDVYNKEASQFLLESKGFDYIDIDPFGNPAEFLDAAVKRLSRCGILAVTATDTSALCGTYPKVCKRKYWAVPIRNELMHEVGLRILIRRIQLIGAQYEKALTPIFSYAKDHYMRVFLKSKKSKRLAAEIFDKHKAVELSKNSIAGPLWSGQLNEPETILEMLRKCKDEKNKKFLEMIKKETETNAIFFYDIHKEIKKNKLNKNPRKQAVIDNIRKEGFLASETHFCPTAVKTNMHYERFLEVLKE
ncbi:MAG: tRNA (guanine(26)-N(2))-dimethyltransferase [Nanoarchaeota archaeon]